jgi:hypothetical protein
MKNVSTDPAWRRLVNLGVGLFAAGAGVLVFVLGSLFSLGRICGSGPLEGLLLVLPFILFFVSIFMPVWLVKRSIPKIQALSTASAVSAFVFLGVVNFVGWPLCSGDKKQTSYSLDVCFAEEENE